MTQNQLKQLLDEIAAEARATAIYTGRSQFAPAVMAAMEAVDRRQFVPEAEQSYAYYNGPLPIGYGQTISQPYIVALMTDLLDLTPDSVVLEIGTGSGYQTAILAQLARAVYSIEKIPQLAETAGQRLKALGYANIHIRNADGYRGWEEQAPFDAIIVTAAASDLPQPLLDQIKPGGCLVIPVGLPHRHQELLRVKKQPDASIDTESLLAVAFVPLVTDEPVAGHPQDR